MCILQLLDGIFCKFNLIYKVSILKFLWWFFFCLNVLRISESGIILKSPSLIVLGSICAFMSSSICFMKSVGPNFTSFVFCWWIIPFINMNWPSLSLLIHFGLNSTLSDMSVGHLICFQAPFAWNIILPFFPCKPVFIFVF
jgi:hypothetical protein